jgi:DNA-binding MarR family transcriptional regulator
LVKLKRRCSDYCSGYENVFSIATPLQMNMLKCINGFERRFVEISRETGANHSSVSKFLTRAIKYGLIRERMVGQNGRHKKAYVMTALGKEFVFSISRFAVLFGAGSDTRRREGDFDGARKNRD